MKVVVASPERILIHVQKVIIMLMVLNIETEIHQKRETYAHKGSAHKSFCTNNIGVSSISVREKVNVYTAMFCCH